MFSLSLPELWSRRWHCDVFAFVLAFAFIGCGQAPFEGPATVKPPALPEDNYCQARRLSSSRLLIGRAIGAGQEVCNSPKGGILMVFEIMELIDAMFYPLYVARGRRPWTLGYHTAKRRQVENAIDAGSLKPGSVLPAGYGYRLDERIIEYPWVYSRLSKCPGLMLDAGSALNYKFLLKRPPVSEANLSICTLAPEKRCYWRRGISYVFDDLRSSRFRSGAFDTIVSISTIEHIGLDNTLLYTTDETKREADSEGFRVAVREFRRVIRPGGVCFITVPYGKACKHGWFQVFDAEMVRMVLDDFQPTNQEIDYFGYSPEGWHLVDPDALTDATCFDINQDRGNGSDFAAFARGLVCMRLVA
jgi:SAM-dependent methyltransferase